MSGGPQTAGTGVTAICVLGADKPDAKNAAPPLSLSKRNPTSTGSIDPPVVRMEAGARGGPKGSKAGERAARPYLKTKPANECRAAWALLRLPLVGDERFPGLWQKP